MFLDLYSRMVVGWSMKERYSFELVTDAPQMAVAQRNPQPGLVVHSDQGLQCSGTEHRRMLTQRQMVGSMSRRGDCWDNAVAETFFGTLKQELASKHGFSSKLQARSAVFEFIEVFYNGERIHSALGYHAPVEFEIAA